MKTFTKEQMEFLKPHEDQLFRATYQEYYRSTNTKLLEEFKAIYDSVADKPADTNWSCGHCVLAFLKKVGQIYFDTKKELERVVEEVKEEVKTVKEQPVKKTNTSRGKKTSKK
jgi:Skp family chaperone for outer membrane proteins